MLSFGADFAAGKAGMWAIFYQKGGELRTKIRNEAALLNEAAPNSGRSKKAGYNPSKAKT